MSENNKWGNLEHMENRLGLSIGPKLSIKERQERIREAYASEMESGDPDSADKLRNYSEVDLVYFIDQVVQHDRRKLS
jgi:hypothetical protein